MTALTSRTVKDFALDHGLDLVGIANIERFADAPQRMHPASIMPRAKSVIVVCRRIVRGNWRGIEEGTYWPAYNYFGYHGLLNSFFIPMPLYDLACFIEDHGYEAVPYYPGVPERQPPEQPLRPGAVGPEVHLAIRIAGIAAGLGEMGWSKVFLTKKFGPRVRLHAIITEAELRPDPLVEPGTLCNRCMSCVQECASGAIPHKRENRTVRIRIEDNTYEWADIHLGRCVLGYHGGDPMVSPFIHKSLPGYHCHVPSQDISENNAYKSCWPMSLDKWPPTEEDPSGYRIEGHAMLQMWGQDGSFGVCGSRGCMRSCFNYLEKKEKCQQTFAGGEFIKRKRWLLSSTVASEVDVRHSGLPTPV